MTATLDWVEGEARVAWILAGWKVRAIAEAFGTNENAVQMQKIRVRQALADGEPSRHMKRFAELGLLPSTLTQTPIPTCAPVRRKGD